MKNLSLEQLIKEGNNLAIACPNEVSSQRLFDYLSKYGFKWRSSRTLIEDTEWYNYEDQTVYFIDVFHMDISIGQTEDVFDENFIDCPEAIYANIEYEDVCIC